MCAAAPGAAPYAAGGLLPRSLLPGVRELDSGSSAVGEAPAAAAAAASAPCAAAAAAGCCCCCWSRPRLRMGRLPVRVSSAVRLAAATAACGRDTASRGDYSSHGALPSRHQLQLQLPATPGSPAAAGRHIPRAWGNARCGSRSWCDVQRTRASMDHPLVETLQPSCTPAHNSICTFPFVVGRFAQTPVHPNPVARQPLRRTLRSGRWLGAAAAGGEARPGCCLAAAATVGVGLTTCSAQGQEEEEERHGRPSRWVGASVRRTQLTGPAVEMHKQGTGGAQEGVRGRGVPTLPGGARGSVALRVVRCIRWHMACGIPHFMLHASWLPKPAGTLWTHQPCWAPAAWWR